jgi:hypothetical protein
MKSSKDYYKIKPGYIEGIYIKHYDSLEPSSKKYNPLDEGLKDATKSSINYKYIETEVNIEFDTITEAIKNNNYIRK